MKNLNINQMMLLYCFRCPNLEFTTKRLRYVGALATDFEVKKWIFNLSKHINQDGVAEGYAQMHSDIKDFFSPDDDLAGAFVLTSMWWDDDFAA